MNTRIGLLSAIALVQLLLIAAFWFSGSAENESAATLLSVDKDTVTGITIDDGPDSVSLQLEDSVWRVNGANADAAKLDGILEKLADLAAPWPVASTSASATRFEVDDDNYQRRVRLFAGDDLLAELYLGTSPGYQRVHARLQGSDDVFSVALSNYELGVDTDAWLDKSVLALPAAPTRVVANFTEADGRTERLEKNAEGWLYNDAAADQDAAQQYADRYTTLSVLGLVADASTAAPLATIEVESTEGAQTFELARLPGSAEGVDGDYVVRRAGDALNFRLASYIAEQLLMDDAEFAAADSSEDT